MPWLLNNLNSSIQQNICGQLDLGVAVDEKCYQAVLHACALDTGMQSLSDGDRSVIGSKSLILSGGLKQHLALAQCV